MYTVWTTLHNGPDVTLNSLFVQYWKLWRNAKTLDDFIIWQNTWYDPLQYSHKREYRHFLKFCSNGVVMTRSGSNTTIGLSADDVVPNVWLYPWIPKIAMSRVPFWLRSGARLTNDVSIEFEIRPRCALVWFKTHSTYRSEILHTPRQCNCRDMCKISLWSVEHIAN